MHSAAEIDQTIRLFDQGRQNERRQGVDGQDCRVPLGRLTPVSHQIDAGIVDDRVHAPDLVHLIGNRTSFTRAAEIADNEPRRSRDQISERRGALRRTRMQNHLMTFAHQRAGCRQAETIRGAGNKYATHVSHLCRSRICAQLPAPGAVDRIQRATRVERTTGYGCC